MNMKEHILAAMREQLDRWEKVMAHLSEVQIVAPNFDLEWSIKDVIAHLWAWQQVSIARVEAGIENREPAYPKWIVESIEDWEEDSDRVNALTFERYHEKPWSEIHENWKRGFSHLLEVASDIPEPDLLDGDRYAWLHGHSLAAILIASYDHHQEHYEKLARWLQEHNK